MSGATHSRGAFTEKQWAFINAMVGEAAGNGSKAAELAGYAVPAQEASRLLKKAQVRAKIDELFETSPFVASRNERLCLLTKIARDEGKSDMARIRAMELMASMQGDAKLKVDMRQSIKVSVEKEREEMKSMIDDMAGKQEPAQVSVH